MVRIGALMVWAGSMGLLGACVSVKKEEAPRPFLPDPLEPAACVEGEFCYCNETDTGVRRCNPERSCDCSACPKLEVNEPSSASCGGDPVGTWLLTDFELAPSTISVTALSTVVATCDTVFELKEAPPHVLMALGSNGLAEYSAEPATATQAWSESCVAGQAPSLTCGSSKWMNVTNCDRECDVCRCDIQTTAYEADRINKQSYYQDGSTLTIAPFGVALTGGYCVQGDVLEVTSDAGYMAFRRVYRYPHCDLRDLGRVAGCEQLDAPPVCQGEVMPCTALAFNLCDGTPGCEEGRCDGPALDCADVENCVAPCVLGASGCEGMSSCGAFNTLEKCHGDANSIFPDTPCRWLDMECGGTALPCAEIPTEQCDFVPGCQLMAP